jgi:hypothetical protein
MSEQKDWLKKKLKMMNGEQERRSDGVEKFLSDVECLCVGLLVVAETKNLALFGRDEVGPFSRRIAADLLQKESHDGHWLVWTRYSYSFFFGCHQSYG